jgi:Glycosyl hydrolase 108
MSTQSFAILKTAENEGGYAKPFGKSGETYAGIDRLHMPGWAGWQIIDAIKRSSGIKQGQFIKGNTQLDVLIEQAHKKYYTASGAGRLQNQNLAAFYFDFYFHKPAIATGFINDYAIAAGINDTAGASLTNAVAAFVNANYVKIYQRLWQDRMAHYAKGKHPVSYKGDRLFYKASKNGLINRVNRYPQTVAQTNQFLFTKNFWE